MRNVKKGPLVWEVATKPSPISPVPIVIEIVHVHKSMQIGI